MNSCINDTYDFNQRPDLNLGPFITPLAKINFTLADFLTDLDTVLQLQADSSLRLVYTLDTFGRITSRDIFEFAPSYATSVSIDLPFALFRPDTVSSSWSLGQIVSQLDVATQAQFSGLNGSTALFPTISPQSAGSASIPSFANFSNVTSLPSFFEMRVVNNLPVAISTLVVSVYSQGTLVTTFPFNQINAGSPALLTVPSTGGVIDGQNMTYQIDQIAVLGSGSSVPINFNDAIDIELRTVDLKGTAGTGIVDLSLLPPVAAGYAFSFDNNEEATEFKFSSGSLVASFSTPIPIGAMLRLPNFTNESGQTFEVNVSGGGGSQSGDLSEVVADLDLDANSNANFIQLELQFNSNNQNTVTFGPADLSFSLNLDLQNLDYAYAIGYFGNRTIEIDTTDATIGITPFQDFVGLVQFNDPVARAKVYNEIGLPIRLNMDLEGENSVSGSVEGLALDESVASPSLVDMGMGVVSNIELNAQNSNFAQFLSILPSSVSGTGAISFNDAGNLPPYENHLIQDGVFQVGFEMELGLNFDIQDLTFSDTVDIAGLDLGLGDSTQLEKFILYVNTENGFSLSGNVTVSLIDGNGLTLTSSSGNLLDPATVTSSGRVIEAGLSSIELSFDEQALNAIDDRTQLVFNVEFESPNNGTDPIIVHYSNFINLYLATQIQLSSTL